MNLFFDTSAWVPLLIQESASTAMWDAKMEASGIWAWSWMQVETEAALIRRRATTLSWQNWNRLSAEVSWVDLETDETAHICLFNRALGLRAADAGHLFVFDRLFREIPEMVMLTLDSEMALAARRIGLPLHAASSPATSPDDRS